MSQNPQFPGAPPPTDYYQAAPAYVRPPGTSGLAVASLILGILGLPSCCLPVCSVLALVFGIMALGRIKRGMATGRGVAVAGITLGALGLILAAALYGFALLGPRGQLLPASQISASQRAALQELNAVPAGEEIQWLSLFNAKQPRAGGIILTPRHVILFSAAGPTRTCALKEVKDVKFMNFQSSLVPATYRLTFDDDSTFEFMLTGSASDRAAFNENLQKNRAALRSGSTQPALGEPSDEEERGMRLEEDRP